MILPKLTFKWERWKFNKDYGVYVSTLGHFKDRYKRDIPIKISANSYVAIKTEQGYRSAHRLVMITWRPTDDAENLTVDHLNHNKRDNSLANLEWVTEKENKLRARNDRLTKKENKEINENCKSKTVETTNPNKRKQTIESVIVVYQKGKECGRFLTEEEFADFIIASARRTPKKNREQIIKLAKVARRRKPQEREYLGFTWKWVKK